MMSGDIELNPGPLTNVSNKVRASLPAYNIVENRLQQLGLRPLDVSGEGECFFRAISHQLYGDCNRNRLLCESCESCESCEFCESFTVSALSMLSTLC